MWTSPWDERVPASAEASLEATSTHHRTGITLLTCSGAKVWQLSWRPAVGTLVVLARGGCLPSHQFKSDKRRRQAHLGGVLLPPAVLPLQYKTVAGLCPREEAWEVLGGRPGAAPARGHQGLSKGGTQAGRPRKAVPGGQAPSSGCARTGIRWRREPLFAVAVASCGRGTLQIRQSARLTV